MESRKQEVNIFKGTVSKVMGLQFAGSSLLPFLWNKTVQAFFNSCGICPDVQMMRKILVITVRRKGHRLKQMIEV